MTLLDPFGDARRAGDVATSAAQAGSAEAPSPVAAAAVCAVLAGADWLDEERRTLARSYCEVWLDGFRADLEAAAGVSS